MPDPHEIHEVEIEFTDEGDFEVVDVILVPEGDFEIEFIPDIELLCAVNGDED
ncbi:MAG: hypothetical protein KKE29_20000 [Proteobacteria bacterium]|nr:hypothetical protein [Pseudomonadota bacterium]MBU4576007.1 hypothetical protein [Pseudomonadota bacterium]MBV1715973.1 hypothetical protein [Desulfarculus sp.]